MAIELESNLRQAGHLVFYDSSRKGIWYFRLVEKDGGSLLRDSEALASLDSSILVLGYNLTVVEEGAFEAAHVQRGRTPGPQSLRPIPTNASPTTPAALDHAHRSAFAHALQSSHQPSPEHESTATQKTAYENFIVAILLAITTAFCPTTGAIPLNYRTVLLPSTPSEDKSDRDTSTDHCALLGTLNAYLTTVGSLVISFSVSQCQGLLSLESYFAASLTSTGQRIVAAPFGVHASNPTATLGELGTASLAQTPNTQALSIRGYSDLNGGLWKQSCLKMLQLRGIPSSVLENCSWVHVTIPKRRLQDARGDGARSRDTASTSTTTIPWPGPLCFRQRAVETSSTTRLGDNILSGREEHRDPLGRAGRWLDSSAEREDQFARRKADRAALSSLEADGSATRPQVTEGQTPLTLGRPSTAIASAMYPTPPDAIQQLNGVTPTFEHVISSPRNPPSAPAITEVEDVMRNEPDTNHSSDIGDLSDAKRERSDSNLLGDAENMLIGGGDMFGDDDDITDADFNFFDEQPGETDVTMTDFDGEDTVLQKQAAANAEHTRHIPAPIPTKAVQVPPDSDVFTKPDLKDARSFLNDSQVARPATEIPSAKPHQPSRFDSITVFKQMKASLTPANIHSSVSLEARKRKANVFEKLDFGPVMPLINKKYEKGGLFDFEPSPAKETKIMQLSKSLPETEYLKRHGKRNRRPRELGLQSRTLMARFTALGAPTSHPSPFKRAASPSDDEQSSVESDQDDTSYTSDDPGSPLKSSMRRLAVDDDAVSNITSLRDPEVSDEADQRLVLELPRLAKPELPETSLSKLFRETEPLNLELPLTDEDMIQIAQLVTEQAATGSLAILDSQKLNGIAAVADEKGNRQHVAATARLSMKTLQAIAPSFLGNIKPSRLKAILEIPDIPAIGPHRSMQPRPVPGRESGSEQMRPNTLYHIPYHHLEVRRSDTRLSMLPSSINFWESLGLGPASGNKNAHAVCAFPGWSGMMDSASTFIERMKGVYELLKLGTFNQLPLPSELQDGLLPYEVDRISTSPDASVTKQGSTLIESLDILHAAISDLSVPNTNLIVFMVYTPSNPGTIVESCLAFQRFFEAHKKTLASKHEYPQNELVLQLVSADLISSPSSLVVTPTSDLFKLCMEIYDRCTLFDGPMPAPAIILEQTLPRLIDFKLSSAPSTSLMHENSSIFVAYAQSLDERWVTAAWTDDRGIQQATAAYCLGRKGRPLSSTMNEIANEIWESTLELIAHRRVHWRINITKSGVMDRQEVECWSELAKTENKANVTMILVTVDTSPWLQLVPPVAQVAVANANLYTTPVSTPQANVVSPEASATPATPVRDTHQAEGPGEADASSALLDLTDQTWGAVLGHRLNNSTTLLELQPALASGYLIKKTGARLEDTPTVMEVNLIHTENTARMYDPLFREILHNFKGLGTLARARGVVDKEKDVRPWHVAAAEKALRALYMLM